MRSLIYVGLHDGNLYSSASGSAYTLPTFYARTTRALALRFLNSVDGTLSEVNLNIRGIKASIGYVDQRPDSGQFQLQIGAGPSAPGNTTTAMDWSVTAAQLTAALNAVATAPDDFKVDVAPGCLIIRRAGGEAVALSVVSNTLKPTSFVRIEGNERSGKWSYELRLLRAPLVFTSQSTQILPDKPTIETIEQGATDPSGTYKQNEIQRLHIPPDFKALYCLRRGTNRTALLSRTDGIDQIKAALDAMLALDKATCAVTNPETNYADIEFQGELSGIDVAELVVDVPEESTPPGDWTFLLDFRKWELLEALRSVSSLTDLVIEVTADIVDNPEDLENEDVPSRTIPLFTKTVTVSKPLAWEALATAANIDWLRPPAPKKYTPFAPGQILTGQQQAYELVIGDGVAEEFVADHNLASGFAHVFVRENAPGGRLLRNDEYTVNYDSENSLTISGFADTPAANQYKASIFAIGPESVFQAHNHDMAQIIGLVALLNGYSAAIAALQEIVITQGPPASSASGTGLVINIPPFSELITLPEVPEGFITDGGFDLSKLPNKKPPYLLPALHVNAVTNVTAVPANPAAAPGTVYKNNAAPDLIVYTGAGFGKATVKQNEFFASDGRVFYKVTKDGANNSYYPVPFERTLFVLPINDKQFAINRKLTVLFGVQVAALKADCAVRWVLSVDIGSFNEQSTPSPVGINLENITWSAPVFEQPIDLSTLIASHFFGIEIMRGSTEIRLSQILYGVPTGNNAAAPATANFVLRARLIKEDTANNFPQARGWIFHQLVGSVVTNEDGSQTIKPASAVIS